MAKLNPDTHVLLDGAAKVYLRSNTKRWQATFQIEGQWIRISTGKRDLEEAKTVAREHYLDYKFRSKHDLPIVTKRFANVAQLCITDMQRQLDAGQGARSLKIISMLLRATLLHFLAKYSSPTLITKRSRNSTYGALQTLAINPKLQH